MTGFFVDWPAEVPPQGTTAGDFTLSLAGIRMSGPPQFSTTPRAVTAVRRQGVLLTGPTASPQFALWTGRSRNRFPRLG